MEFVGVRVCPEHIAVLDEMVRRRLARNRSSAIRKAILMASQDLGIPFYEEGAVPA